MTTKISAMTAATAAMSFVPAIDGTPANFKVPVNAVWGLHQFDGSGNLLPTADTVGTLGLVGTRWAGAFFSGTTTTQNLAVNGTGGQGYVQIARNTVAPSAPSSA